MPAMLIFASLVWVFTTVLCTEFFITTDVNRYRFRYWSVVALFNVFYSGILAYTMLTCDTHLIDLSDSLNVIIYLAMFEVMIYPTKVSRGLESALRCAYAIFTILTFEVVGPLFIIPMTAILLYALMHTMKDSVKCNFAVIVILNGITNLFIDGPMNIYVPMYIISTLYLAFGIYMMYNKEKIEGQMFTKVVEHVSEEHINKIE